MDHPNIARIYDGGLTPAGQPFFVMELVKGVPLTQYCDAKRLSVQAGLELFVAVCQAVQHAHQKGIIHRDLKPGNVLVTEVDGRPTPKVIDFGVAKATEVLDRAAEKVGKRFTDQPELELALRDAIYKTYHGLASWEKAETQLRAKTSPGRTGKPTEFPRRLPCSSASATP